MATDDSLAPLDCRTVVEMLLAYIDDETSAADAARIAVHLDKCVKCGLKAETVLALKIATINGAAGAAPDSEAVDRLRAFAQTLATRGNSES